MVIPSLTEAGQQGLRSSLAARLWLKPDLLQAWGEGLPRAGQDGVIQVRSSGRGSLLRVALGDGHALIRTYRRGGALGPFLPDVFLSAARARAECVAVARLFPLGIAPEVLGLEVSGRLFKRIRIAVAEVPGALDVLRLAQEKPDALDEVALATELGRAVATMHDAGVAHADLNAANLLVSKKEGGRVTIVDFDGARLLPGPVPLARRRVEVLRLCRSVDKWRVSSALPARCRAAFLRAALPESERLSLLRAGREQHGRRLRSGRTDLPREGV